MEEPEPANSADAPSDTPRNVRYHAHTVSSAGKVRRRFTEASETQQGGGASTSRSKPLRSARVRTAAVVDDPSTPVPTRAQLLFACGRQAARTCRRDRGVLPLWLTVCLCILTACVVVDATLRIAEVFTGSSERDFSHIHSHTHTPSARGTSMPSSSDRGGLYTARRSRSRGPQTAGAAQSAAPSLDEDTHVHTHTHTDAERDVSSSQSTQVQQTTQQRTDASDADDLPGDPRHESAAVDEPIYTLTPAADAAETASSTGVSVTPSQAAPLHAIDSDAAPVGMRDSANPHPTGFSRSPEPQPAPHADEAVLSDSHIGSTSSLLHASEPPRSVTPQPEMQAVAVHATATDEPAATVIVAASTTTEMSQDPSSVEASMDASAASMPASTSSTSPARTDAHTQGNEPIATRIHAAAPRFCNVTMLEQTSKSSVKRKDKDHDARLSLHVSVPHDPTNCTVDVLVDPINVIPSASRSHLCISVVGTSGHAQTQTAMHGAASECLAAGASHAYLTSFARRVREGQLPEPAFRVSGLHRGGVSVAVHVTDARGRSFKASMALAVDAPALPEDVDAHALPTVSVAPYM